MERVNALKELNVI